MYDIGASISAAENWPLWLFSPSPLSSQRIKDWYLPGTNQELTDRELLDTSFSNVAQLICAI